MRKMRYLAVAVSILLAASEALAAPFCVPIAGGQPMCIYDDAAACALRAASERQSCLINPADIKVPASASAYCSVDSERNVQCIYDSFAQCDANIRRGTAFCFGSGVNNTVITEPDRLRGLAPTP